MGAWGEKAYDSDTGCEWVEGVAEHLKFTLLQGFWNRYKESGIAAAQLLVELPAILQERIGPQPFVEALEVVDGELEPEKVNEWRVPAKRKQYLTSLKSALEKGHKYQAKLAEDVRKRMSQMFAKTPKHTTRKKSLHPKHKAVRRSNTRRMQTKNGTV